MLCVDRGPHGAYVVLVLFPHAAVLAGLPGRVRDLLADPSRNRNVIGRLFPAAYADPRQEAEYRRLLGSELLARKEAGIDAFQRSVDSAELLELDRNAGKGRVERLSGMLLKFEEKEFELWLGFVNDVRLILGTELDIQADGWSGEPIPEKGPQADDWMLLHLLSWLEEELLRAASR